MIDAVGQTNFKHYLLEDEGIMAKVRNNTRDSKKENN